MFNNYIFRMKYRSVYMYIAGDGAFVVLYGFGVL